MNIIVAAAVRDVQPQVDAIMSNILKIAACCDSLRCIIVESCSKDSTIQSILRYSDLIPIETHSITHSNPLFTSSIDYYFGRTERIAEARNHYLDIVQEKYSDFDYMVVMDFNETNVEELDMEGFMSNFSTPEDWNMIGANQSKKYYDLWALRHDEWMPFDCWEKVRNRPSFMTETEAQYLYVRSRFINIEQNHPLIKVDSAFGGTSIIKIPEIKNARHSGSTAENVGACEWVSFCKQLGKVFINPRFINQTQANKHTVF